MPKSCAQKRLTATRAVSGFSGSTSHRARPSRSRGAPFGQRVERGRDAGLDLLAGVEEVPLEHEIVVAPLVRRQLDHHREGRGSSGLRLLQPGDLVADGLERGRDRAIVPRQGLAPLGRSLVRRACRGSPGPMPAPGPDAIADGVAS